MRVAFVGKGGAGKSSIAGAFARLLARRGREVIALDSDPMPGLAYSLGMPATDTAIPDEAVEERSGTDGAPRLELRGGLSADAAVELYGRCGPDGVRLLQFGKLRGNVSVLARSQSAFRLIIEGLSAQRWSLVGDLPGGTRQPFFGWGNWAQLYLVVVEPSPASILSAQRLAHLASMPSAPTVLAVANKVREPADRDLIAAESTLEVVASVPYDSNVLASDCLGTCLLDHAPGTPALQAVESLVRYASALEQSL